MLFVNFLLQYLPIFPTEYELKISIYHIHFKIALTKIILRKHIYAHYMVLLYFAFYFNRIFTIRFIQIRMRL